MATYTELFDLRSNSAFLNKITVAIVKEAQVLIDKATPSIAEITWAGDALNAPRGKADAISNYVLGANSALTTTQILNASDSAIQSNVSAAVAKLIAGGV